MRWRSAVVPVLPVLLALSGCATSYVYQPTMSAAPESGYLVARYAVPPERPQGELLVMSSGVTRMDVAPEKSVGMLHVRLGATNTSAPVPWTVDAREQLVTIAGRGPLNPSYANSDSGGPVVTVPPGQSRVLDLYYPLAPAEQSERDVPFFEVTWKVHAGDRVVAERTPFQRTEAPVAESAAPSPYFAVGLGWSPYWWYDPLWPYPVAGLGFGFPLILHHHGVPFVVGTPGHLHARAGWYGHPVGPGPAFRGPAFRGPAVAPPVMHAPAPAPAPPGGGGFHGHPVR